MARRKSRTEDAEALPEWFDFVAAYSKKLDDSLKFPATESIRQARTIGISNPEYALIECRKVVEAIVNSYDGGVRGKMALRLFDLVAKKEITAQQSGWLKRIWRKASVAVHPARKELEYDTHEALEILDHSLRAFIKDKINKTFVTEQPMSGSLFIDAPRDGAEELLEIAASDSTLKQMHGFELNAIEQKVDAAIYREDGLDQQAAKIHQAIVDIESDIQEHEAKLRSKFDMIDALENEADNLLVGTEVAFQIQSMVARAKADYVVLTNLLDDARERKAELLKEYSSIVDSKKDLQSDFEKTTERLEAILAEHDWIARILSRKGEATKQRLDTINRNDSMFKVRGGTGTGKSLLLMMRCLRELSREASTPPQEAIDFGEIGILSAKPC
jgi:hypothetical protein